MFESSICHWRKRRKHFPPLVARCGDLPDQATPFSSARFYGKMGCQKRCHADAGRIHPLLTIDSTSLKLVREGECDPEKWTALNETAATGYITQTWEWGQLTHLGEQMHRVAVANAAGDYVALMLMVETRAPVIGRPYLYAPRGPVCDDPDSPALPLLLQGVEAIAR